MPILKRTYIALTVILLTFFSASLLAANPATKADKVKAAIVYKLTKFITWPEKKQTLALCIIGSGSINNELLKINHKFSMGRRISVTHKKYTAPLEKLCDLTFIHNTDTQTMVGILHRLQNKPVLTISDNANFTSQGGIIGLFRTGSKIRFAISQSATKNSGLSISNQLMGLAKVIK
ncbi:YfiR family protein [Endozoicomonas sp.]|uniref:YfiR family protein n=1 Tax=Endozoicomonas sp. TaxID=1892382 RepID=UPI00288834CE|nr:YfiR family protein [Endozoicomonas sp.]